MDNIQFSHLNRRFLQVVIPVILAVLFLAAIMGVGASSASQMEAVTFDQETNILTNGNVITIGVASSLSGLPDLGWRQVNAVQLAVDQINAGGGLDIGGTNYTLALVSADSGCNPTQAVTAANTLLNAGVVAVVGHACSSASSAAQPLYAAAGVSMISPSSTDPQVTEQGYTTTFRVISRDDTPTTMLATHLHNRLTYERAAIVEIDGFWGNWLGDVFSDTFTGLGGVITSRHTVTSTADFTATLTTIMAENPDVIHFVNDDGNTAGLLSKVADNLGMTNVVIAWTKYTENRGVLDDYANTAGVAAEGDIAAMFYRATEDMSGYADFDADYVAAGFANYGDEAQMTGAFAYDAAQIIKEAIDRTDSTDPADIRDEVTATNNYPGVVGMYEGFDNKGDVIPQWAWMEQYQDGQWVVIWPYKIFLPIMLKNYGQ